MNDTQGTGLPIANSVSPLEMERPAFPLGRPPSCRAILCSSLWSAVRDGSATMLSSLITLGGAIGVRTLLSHVPGLHHGFMLLTAGINGVAGATLGSHVGGVIAGRAGRWVGGAGGAMAGATMVVLAICQQDEEGQNAAAASLFATALYSGLRELFQGKFFKPQFPSLALPPGKSLRWERGSNTSTHVGRLGIQLMIYAATCTTLNGMAAKNVIGPTFGLADEPLDLYSLESTKIFGFRSLNEALDALVGSLLLAGLFRPDIHIQPNWCQGHPPSWHDWWHEASSRIFMNGGVASITRLLPQGAPLWLGSMLTSVTTVRGALANLRPSDKGLVRRHFELVVAHLKEKKADPGYERCNDPDPLIQGLPPELSLALWMSLETQDQGVFDRSLESQWNAPERRRALVSYLDGCYHSPGRELERFMKPFLEQERKCLDDEGLQLLPREEEKSSRDVIEMPNGNLRNRMTPTGGNTVVFSRGEGSSNGREPHEKES